MKPYSDWNGNSGVSRYDDSAADFIVIEFNRKQRYKYTGEKVAELKRLAASGHGLSEYINKNKSTLQEEKLADSESYR